MHDDSALVTQRIERVMRTVRPHAWEGLGALEAEAWTVGGEPVDFATARAAQYEPLAPGTWWGRAWDTMWVRLTGTVPEGAERVEASIDLGFSGDWAGNQCEGMVFTGDGRPLKAVNPMNQNVALPSGTTAVELWVEAAANPNLSHHIGEPMPSGDPLTIPDELLYRYAGASLVRRRDEVYGLLVDLEVLHGLMLELPADSTRRARILRALEDACDELDSTDVVGTATAARAALAPALSARANASAQRMTAVGHAHIDSAWLWPVRETKRKTVRTFSNVLALAREYPDFAFACTTAQQYEWVREASPEVFAGIREAIGRGQWHPVGGMWVESDANLPGGEALVRQFTSGLRWMQEHLGVRPRCLWLPDSFGYTAALPQIAKLAGMQWFFTQKLSWNRTNSLPHHTFWWEGLDGSRIWTHFPPVDCYDSVVSPREVKKAEANFKEKGRTAHSLLPFGYGDGGGGPTREMMERIHRLADLEDAPRVVPGSPDEFFEAASADYPTAPTWAGELYLEFHRGCYTSQAAMKRGNRRSEAELARVEALATMAGLRGADYPHQELEDLWRQVLLLQFHDILPGSSIAWVHREAREDYARIGERLDALASSALAGLGDDLVEVVVNPSGSERLEVVEVDGEQVLVGVAPFSVTAVDDAVVSAGRLVETTRVGESFVLDNGLVRIEVDADGLLCRVTDLVNQREVLVPGMRAGLLQLHPDLPSSFDAWELEDHYRHRVTDLVSADSVRLVRDSGLVATLEVRRGFGASSVVETISLQADSMCVDFDWTIDWQERERVLKLAFPVAVQASESTAEVQFGHVRRPINANTSWDAARFEVWAHRWMLVDEPGYGVAVANDSTYGHDITPCRGADGRRGTNLRLSLLRGPGSPDADCDRGLHQMRTSLVVGADVPAAHVAGVRLNQPLQVTEAVGAPPPVVSLHSGIVIDAVKQAFDGSGDVVVRLHEALGASARGELELGFDVSQVSEVDLLEDPVADPSQGEALSAHLDSGSLLGLELRPFQVLTIRLRPSSEVHS